MIVVDTSVWIDWIRRRETEGATKLELLINKDLVAVGDIVLFEILQGARDDLHAKKLERVMAHYKPVDMLDRRLALAAAANYRLLRVKGITIRSAAPQTSLSALGAFRTLAHYCTMTAISAPWSSISA